MKKVNANWVVRWFWKGTDEMYQYTLPTEEAAKVFVLQLYTNPLIDKVFYSKV